MNRLKLAQCYAHPRSLSGPIVEAALDGVTVGEICDVRRHWCDIRPAMRAQVIGFRNELTVLSLLGDPRGISRESLLMPTGGPLHVQLDGRVLGAVLDGAGSCIARLVPVREVPLHADSYRLDAAPPSFDQRLPIGEIFHTGISALDGLLTCGIGQRLGIFAPAGAGKTSLVSMLMEHACADVVVLGLIGERGREVTEFVEKIKTSSRADSTVVVFSTSDTCALDRCNAALLATTVAEYFRDRGAQVLLVQDSLTRYARALRDVALAAGEVPARRGYPASVFEALPRLMERPGVTTRGSITAFFTILLENDDESDPLAEEMRSILDGHIWLSRKLASANHYPAIDVLRSLSRVASRVCSESHLRAAAVLRDKLARLEDLQQLLDLGEYRAGESAAHDRLLSEKPALQQWLRQPLSQANAFGQILAGMEGLAR